jgi:WD40 repeat protein
VFFDCTSQRIVFNKSLPGAIWDSFFIDDNTLVCGDTKGTIYIIDVIKQTIESFQIHDDVIRTLAFDPKKRIITTGSYDGHIKQFDLTRKQETNDLDLKQTIYNLKYSLREDVYVASVGKGTLAMISLELNIIRSWQSHQSTIRALLIHPKRPICIAGSEKGTLKIWDLTHTEHPLGTIINGKYEIWNLQFSEPDLLISSDYAGDIYFNRVPNFQKFSRY